MEIKFKKLNPNAVAPRYATESAAGADLCVCADADITIEAGETVMIRTGLAVEIPCGYAGFVFARSGLATKRGLAPANKVGVIDADYRGEISVSLFNQSGKPQTVAVGERVAQLVLLPVLFASFTETDSLSDTARGAGGFGSTGR